MRVLGATGRVLVVLEVVEDGDTVVAGLEVAGLASDGGGRGVRRFGFAR